MLLPAAVCSMLVAFHGGTTTGGTSTSGTSTAEGSSDGTATGAATTGTGGTSSTATGTTGAGSGDTTSTDGTADADGTDLETGPPAEGDEAPSESSDAGVDPTFGPFDESSTDGLDDDFVDGCCDHQDNNSDNFLCRISPAHLDRIALAVVLLLLGRPRRRATKGAA